MTSRSHRPTSISRREAVVAVVGSTMLPGVVDAAQPITSLQVVARSPFLCNAVAVDRSGTLILGLPRWTGMEATPSVARLAPDGSLMPFPGGSWNAWKPGDDGREAFVQVNALHIFGDGTLWVVDQGAPDRKATLPGAQKLVQLDPVDGQVMRILRFDGGILPRGAQMNDLRVFGSRLYVTDSGRGGIIVHDFATGRTLRRLSGHALLRQTAGLPLRGSGRRVLRDAEGKQPAVHSDLIEISADGRWLYVSPPTGPIRRISTALLDDPAVNDAAIASAVETIGTVVTLNGSAIDTRGNLLLCDAEERRIIVLAPDGRRATLVRDTSLINPDALFITADRQLYIPAPQTERLPEHDGGRTGTRPPFQVLAMPLPDSVDGIVLGDAVSPTLSTEHVMDRSRSRGIEHVGITVPDHAAAVRFFEEAFGATRLFSLVKKGQAPMGADQLTLKNDLAPGTAIVAVTMMRMRHGPNIEIFEIANAEKRSPAGISDYGMSHFSVTVDDMAAVTARFAAAGGTLLQGPYNLSGQEEGAGNQGRFGRTPWGLLIEFESFGSPIAYDSEATEVRWFPEI